MSDSGDPSSHGPSHERGITQEEQWLLDHIAAPFIETGDWPQLAKIKRQAAREDVDLPQILYGQTLQDFLWRPDLNDIVLLSVPGLARTRIGEPVADKFVGLAQLMLDRYLADDDDPPQVHGSDLQTVLGYGDTTIARIGKVLPTENFLTAGGSPASLDAPVEWWYYVNETIVRFKACTPCSTTCVSAPR